jgi:hypothetical protein
MCSRRPSGLPQGEKSPPEPSTDQKKAPPLTGHPEERVVGAPSFVNDVFQLTEEARSGSRLNRLPKAPSTHGRRDYDVASSRR